MDSQIENQIQQTVIEILKNSDMDKVTESMVRKSASQKLGIDLSHPEAKTFVRKVIDSCIAEAEEEEENGDDVEYDDVGNLIICKLSSKRRVTISEFKGKTLISIREYYNNGTKELPSTKGISLTVEQWAELMKHAPAIEKAIKKN